MSQAMNISAGALEAFAKKRQAGASNIAQEKVTSAKGTYQGLVAQVIGGQAQGVNVVSQNRISAQGGISATNTKSNLAISGQGFFVVASDNTAIAGAGASTSAYYYQRRGDFSITDSDQILRSITGSYKLQGWKLDSQGKLPTDTSTLAGLVDISFKNLSAQATKTTKVSPIMNLSASAEKLKGPGATINLAAGNATKTTSTDGLIVPAGGISGNTYGTLNYGDIFSLNLSGTTATKFQLGGVALTHDITKSAIYGANNSTTAFKVIAKNDNTVPVAGQSIKEGSGINIISNGQTYTFTVSAASAQASTGQFNSLQGLATAIKATKDLTATISDNRLYIASTKDSDSAIEFNAVGPNGRDLIDTLGLYNVAKNDPKQAPNVNRFATLTELEKKISTIGGVSYTAALNAAGGLDFSATNASNSLTVRGYNKHTTQIMKAEPGWHYERTAGMGNSDGSTWMTHRAVKITSNNHGLAEGDYVRIQGSNNVELPAGIYQVTTVSANNDTFAIASVGDIAGKVFPTNGTFTWQKIDAPKASATNAVISGVVNTRCDTTTNGAQALFTALPAYASSIGLKQGDVVYITGSTAVKDGYYVVTANPGNNTSLTVTIVGGNGANGDCNAAPNNAVNETANLRITKVAGHNGAGLDTYSLSITGNAQDQTVTIKTQDANYQINDQIAFRGGGFTKHGVTVTQDKYYTVTNVTGPDANGDYSVTFTADGDNNAGGIAKIGLFGTTDNAGAAPALAAGTFLGPNAYIDNASQFFRALGINDSTVYSLPSGMDATYTSAKLNFASGTVTKNVNTQNVTVYDSLGAPHNLSIGFGKLENTPGGGATWAVEVYDNTPNDIAGGNSLLASGRILFGADGSLQSVDPGLLKIEPAWTNGAATNQAIEFNWGSQGKFDGLTQNNGATNLVSMDQDGQSVGSFIGYEINEKGIVTVQFSNGKTQDVYKIPLALAPNADGMTAVQEGLYTASNASGALLLKEMSVGGAGTVQSSALEDSTIDSATEIVGFIGSVQQAGLNSATMSKDSEAFHELLAAVKSS